VTEYLERPGWKRPILVTGSHRSGTTWAARILHASGATGFIDEAFNPGRKPSWLSVRPEHWYQHVDPSNEPVYARAVEQLLQFRYPTIRQQELSPHERQIARTERLRARTYRARGVRPLMKDPLALFSAEWLASRFEAEVVVLIRHPAGFASSVLRLGWTFGFRQWSRQPSLMQTYLAPFADEIVRAANEPQPLLEQLILMWNAIYAYVHDMRERHPDWKFIRHEDLSLAPLREFRGLYSTLGLPWRKRVTDVIEDLSSPRNVREVDSSQVAQIRRDSAATARIWRERLDANQIERIRQGTERVASYFYTTEDWTF
jgi:hypothetical protein